MSARVGDASPSAGLRLRRIVDVRELINLSEAWSALLEENHPGAIFRSPEWLLPWWNCFSSGKALDVLTLWRYGDLIGLLPLYRVPTALGGGRASLLGDGVVGSDYLGPIARSADRSDVTRVLVRELLDVHTDLRLENVSSDDPLIAELRGRAPAAMGIAITQSTLPCPYIPLPDDYRAWQSALRSGLGEQIDRRRRWLARRPGFSIEALTTPKEIVEGMEVLFRLHRERWASAGGSEGITGEDVQAFHRISGRLLAERGWAILLLLHAEGAPRAALYGFIRGDRFSFYQSGYDPAWRQRSVGTVLLAAAIELAIARGLREFDLLHGAEPYKFRIAPMRRDLVTLRVASGTRARLLRSAEAMFDRVRRIAQVGLPGSLRSWIHRRVRSPQAGGAS